MTDLMLEYGMELTWVGKLEQVIRMGEDKLKEAFPTAEDLVQVTPEFDEMTELEVDAVVQQAGTETTARALFGMDIPQLVRRFERIGFSEKIAKQEANRLAKELVLFDLGLINEIDPYGGPRGVNRGSAVRRAVQQEVAQTTPAGRIGQRRDERNVNVTNRIVASLMEAWRPVGYLDRVGQCGVQWNANNEIEVTSPLHRTLEQAEVFYNHAYRGFTEVLGLPIETEADSGGGGHLHATYANGTGGLRPEVMWNLCWDHCARPYIGWAFNDPNDATEGPAPIEFMSSLLSRAPRNIDFNFRKASGVRWANPSHRNAAGDDRRGIAYTTEFRIFQMARNWSEQKAHILFIEAWVKAASDPDYIKHIEPMRPWQAGVAMGWGRDWAIAKMKEFLTQRLGLDYDMYEDIVERNIITKFEHYATELT